MTAEPYFVDDRHALYVGAVLGVALKHGVPLRPTMDDDGNYTDRLTLDIDSVTVTVVVPPPPADWTIADWNDA